MNHNNEILNQAQAYVSSLLNGKLPGWAVYHNLRHTEEIVEAVQEIGEGSRLNKSEMEIVLLGAWFHDVGYTEVADGHEEKGVEIATQFLQAKGYPQNKIEQVGGCIRATKVPQSPKTFSEEIVCDADVIHLGKKRFFDKSELLRMEMELRTGKTFTDVEWLKKNVEFISQENFHTAYAKEEFSNRRNKNLVTLQEQLRDALAKNDQESVKSLAKKDKAAVKLEKEKRPERGIETMFRVVPKNHLDLSGLADHKASILIGTTATIKVIVFSVLLSKLDTHPYFTIPTFILLGVSLATMIFAILATRPNVTTGTFTREDIHQKKVNLLFFGNFYKSTLEDFDWGMREMMSDSDYLYGSMIKDLYFLGRVLGKKYRYLRIAYNIFMWGLIVSVVAFAIAILTAPVLPVQ